MSESLRVAEVEDDSVIKAVLDILFFIFLKEKEEAFLKKKKRIK